MAVFRVLKKGVGQLEVGPAEEGLLVGGGGGTHGEQSRGQRSPCQRHRKSGRCSWFSFPDLGTGRWVVGPGSSSYKSSWAQVAVGGERVGERGREEREEGEGEGRERGPKRQERRERGCWAWLGGGRAPRWGGKGPRSECWDAMCREKCREPVCAAQRLGGLGPRFPWGQK